MPDPTSLPFHEVLAQQGVAWAVVAWAFLFGLLWGSFFNVCIYRLPMGFSPNRPRRSFCFSCGSPIAWFDNVPLVSWVMLGGRCRHCGARISFRYFVIEAATGLIFALIWWGGNNPSALMARGAVSWSFLWHWAVAGLLIIGTMTDIDHWIIPDGITRGGLWAALAAAIVLPLFSPDAIIARAGPLPAARRADWRDPYEALGALLGISPEQPRARKVWSAPSGTAPQTAGQQGGGQGNRNAPPQRDFRWYEPFLNAALGAVVGYGLLWGIAILGRLVFRREAMGGGDLKLFAFLGAVFGPFNVVVLLFLSSLVGVALGVGAIVWSSIQPPKRARLAELLMQIEAGINATESQRHAGVTTIPERESGEATTSGGNPPASEPTPSGETQLPTSAQSSGASGEPIICSKKETATSAHLSALPGESAPSETPEARRQRLIDEYLIYARKRPAPRGVHHIPFGPSISVAALILLIWNEPIRRALANYLLPAFGG